MEQQEKARKPHNGNWKRLTNWLRGRQPIEAETSEFDKLRLEIEQAHLEWSIAKQHIDHVSEPELIDHAIYHLEATERKYGYLLREAKKRYGQQGNNATETSL